MIIYSHKQILNKRDSPERKYSASSTLSDLLYKQFDFIVGFRISGQKIAKINKLYPILINGGSHKSHLGKL